MRRWHAERDLMLGRWRVELGNHTGSVLGTVKTANYFWKAPPASACNVDCHCANGIGTMRRHRPYDSHGKWKKYEKLFENRKRVNQKRAAIKFELEAEGAPRGAPLALALCVRGWNVAELVHRRQCD